MAAKPVWRVRFWPEHEIHLIWSSNHYMYVTIGLLSLAAGAQLLTLPPGLLCTKLSELLDYYVHLRLHGLSIVSNGFYFRMLSITNQLCLASSIVFWTDHTPTYHMPI